MRHGAGFLPHHQIRGFYGQLRQTDALVVEALSHAE
ncbi:hypothetical protein STEPF1_05301 [Streptomyces sp. F-1]|nr:hypothetical protein STEPF1_05301 [Streptomyces sp. F-1]